MENNQKVTEEEKAKLEVISTLAAVPINVAEYPVVIAIGIPQGIHATLCGGEEKLAFGEANFWFKVLVGLVSAFDFLTPEEEEQITKITSDAMKRGTAARKAAEAGDAAAETSDSAAVEETQTGEEAQHG